MTHSLRDSTHAAGSRDVDEALPGAASVALADDRVVAAEVGLDRRVRPAAGEELELVLDRVAVADEHQSALLVRASARLLHADDRAAERNAAAQDHAQQLSCGLPRSVALSRGLVLRMCAKCGQTLPSMSVGRLREGVAAVAGDRA